MKKLAHLPAPDRAAYGKGPSLGKRGLDALMPLHLWLGPSGFILRAGPTLQKLAPGNPLAGGSFFDIFEFRRPRNVKSLGDITACSGQRIQLMFRNGPTTILKGSIQKLPAGQGVLLNLSLGISVAETVRAHGLTTADFAPSDPTVEMLYLIEAQSAVLGESKDLNTRLEGAKIAAEEQAFTDTLTGLKNRRALDHVMGRLIRAGRQARFGLMHLDLDFFKAVNDTHGHAAGDHVLQQAARIFVEETRSDDIVARIGGDEFVLILLNCDDLERLNTVARRIIDRLEHPIAFDGATCRISASIGITVSTFYASPEVETMSQDGPVTLSCRSGCSFKRLVVQMPRGFSSPMLSAFGGHYRSH